MSKEINELINTIGNLYSELYKINKNIESLYQSSFQKYLPSIISIIAVGGSFGIAYLTSKWSFKNQQKLEKNKYEKEEKEENKKTYGEAYVKIELICASIIELNLERININMYGHLIDRKDTPTTDKKIFENLLYEGRKSHDIHYGYIIKYKSELSYIIGKLHFENENIILINQIMEIYNTSFLFPFNEVSDFNHNIDLIKINEVRRTLSNDSTTFVNEVILPKYRELLKIIRSNLK